MENVEVKPNTWFWEKYKTPPDWALKPFKRPGGFEGIAIDPMWMIFVMTDEFGPIGNRWGYADITEGTYDGPGGLILHWCRLTVFSPLGSHSGIGQTVMVGENKYGLFMNEEAPKCSETDALTKALSKYGIGADIYMGLFDDVKWTREKVTKDDDKERFLAAVESLIEKGLALCDGDWGKRYLAVFGDCMDPKDFETDEKRKEYFIKLTDLVESLA